MTNIEPCPHCGKYSMRRGAPRLLWCFRKYDSFTYFDIATIVVVVCAVISLVYIWVQL